MPAYTPQRCGQLASGVCSEPLHCRRNTGSASRSRAATKAVWFGSELKSKLKAWLDRRQNTDSEVAEETCMAPWISRVVLRGILLSPVEAFCDAPREPATSLLKVAKAKLSQAWTEIDQDMHRAEAELHFPFSQSKIEAPVIRWQDDRIYVKFAVRHGADLASVMSSLSSCLGGRTDSLVRSKAQPGVLYFGPATSGEAELCAQLRMPPASGRQSEVEFSKQGALTDVDIENIALVLRNANTLARGQAVPGWRMQRWRWSSEDDDGGSKGGGDSDDWGAGRSSLFGDLGSQLEALVRLMQGTDGFFRDMREWEAQRGRDFDRRWGRDPPPELPPEASPQAPPPAVRRLDQGSQTQPGGRHDLPPDSASGTQSGYSYGSPAADKAVQKLQLLGAKVYPPESKEVMDWGILAGYEEQKARIEDTLLLALKHPEVFDEVARGTRRHFSSNCPRAILFEGPPGCGKTTSARVIASQASTPLVYVPLEAVGSKWYGESEKLLSKVFEAVGALEGAIVFLDELDSLATTRSEEMHEATRRRLGVLLRQLDGFQTGEGGRTVVLGATNRKQDLDPALLSRFDASITFQLPSCECRRQIIRQYAQHLKDEDVAALAEATAGMSGRDLRDVCEQAERRWAAKIIRKQESRGSFPSADEYQQAVKQRHLDKQLPLDPKRLF